MMDSWFASKENFEFILKKTKRFISALKGNRRMAKSYEDKIMLIHAVFKLDCLKIKHKANHFALRTKLLIKANQIAYEGLRKLRDA